MEICGLRRHPTSLNYVYLPPGGGVWAKYAVDLRRGYRPYRYLHR